MGEMVWRGWDGVPWVRCGTGVVQIREWVRFGVGELREWVGCVSG